MCGDSASFKRIWAGQKYLASRLKHLVDIGIFAILPASDGSAYKAIRPD